MLNLVRMFFRYNRFKNSVGDSNQVIKRRVRRLYRILFLLVGSTLVGTTGFYLIEDYTLLEAFYQTIITQSTVGYSTVRPLSEAGMLFSGIYIICNILIFAYMISMLTSFIFEGELKKLIDYYMHKWELDKMENHVIICGYGRNGARAASELLANDQQVIAIDQDDDIVTRAEALGKLMVIKGNATDDEVLELAWVKTARTVITTLPDDADNVFICLTAKQLNPDVTVIARASSETSISKLQRSGATHVVMPDSLGGIHMARLITQPYVIEFLELLDGTDTRFHLQEYAFDQFRSAFQNKSIRELGVREQSGATIIAYKQKGSHFVFNPQTDVKVEPEDILIVLGTASDISKFEETFITT